jgi:hypothetical protein
MQYSTALSDGVLALACLACALVIGKARKHYGEADQPALFCALLGFLLPAAAAGVGMLRYGFDPGWQGAHLWLSQASSFLALPLLGAASLALGRGWAWSRPNWGRIVLGLCAFFELFRQLGYLEDYRLALNLATLALILYAGALQWPRRAPPAAGRPGGGYRGFYRPAAPRRPVPRPAHPGLSAAGLAAAEPAGQRTAIDRVKVL